nr:hypothetical protein [Pseudovibrio japonicus]
MNSNRRLIKETSVPPPTDLIQPTNCPAWTAVEVAGLRREGGVVEIRVVATINPK